MAITVPSNQTGTATAGVDLVINKPSGLTAGDLMVAHLAIKNTNAEFAVPSGWDALIIQTESSAGNFVLQLMSKIATSGDVAASNFTFTANGSGSGERKVGAIIRIVGHRPQSYITASQGQANASSTTITIPGDTPVEPNSLIMLFGATGTTSARTFSGYTIATSAPSFTEQYDTNNAELSIGCATGVRPEETATGNGTITVSSAEPNAGQLLIISAPQDFTITDSMTMTEAITYAVSIIIAEMITLTETITSTAQRLWSKLSKAITSWTNLPKD